MINIIQLHFERDTHGLVLINDKNVNLFTKYIIPIIENNTNWKTNNISKDKFILNPESFRDDINNATETFLNAQVHIALENDIPTGLIVFLKNSFTEEQDRNFITTLNEIIKNKESKLWEDVKKYIDFNQPEFDKIFPQLENSIYSKSFYSRIGIVLKPELQGKSSIYSTELYNLLNNGIIYGWTSSPLAVAKRRMMFSNTMFFPTEVINKLDIFILSCLSIAMAKMYSKYTNELKTLKFGVNQNSDFELRDYENTIQLAKSLLSADKIISEDLRAFEYILKRNNAQGMLLSYK